MTPHEYLAFEMLAQRERDARLAAEAKPSHDNVQAYYDARQKRIDYEAQHDG